MIGWIVLVRNPGQTNSNLLKCLLVTKDSDGTSQENLNYVAEVKQSIMNVLNRKSL